MAGGAAGDVGGTGGDLKTPRAPRMTRRSWVTIAVSELGLLALAPPRDAGQAYEPDAEEDES